MVFAINFIFKVTMALSSFSAANRADYLRQLEAEHYDLLVIGGGITGAGIALDAVSRGLKVALIEKADFGSGTSSRSTKLIHGGLRYLKQLEFGIVREVGRERAILYRNAPHIVIPERMLLPIVKGGSLGKRSTSLGLYVYDRLAGVERKERRYMLDSGQTLKAEPLLNPDILEGGGIYVEYRSDDARLVIEVMKTAVEKGAVCLNYVECRSFTLDNDKINGADAVDMLTGFPLRIRARKVINACGPWVDTLRAADNSLKGKRLHLTKGVHIVVERKRIPLQQSVYFDVQDGRMIFAIPRGKIVYLGTTDTNYNDSIDHPFATLDDVQYILAAANHMFPALGLTLDDVQSSWAGLRPLIHEDGKSPSDLSRKDEIFISGSGLISIAGGKLTGFRKMAQRSVDEVCKQLKKELNKKFTDCHTDAIPLSGGNLHGQTPAQYARELQTHFTDADVDDVLDLVLKYGSNTRTILELAREQYGNNLLLAEAHYSLHHEMTYSVGDFIVRRTGRLYFERPSLNGSMLELHEFFSQHLKPAATLAESQWATFEAEYSGVLAFKNTSPS